MNIVTLQLTALEYHVLLTTLQEVFKLNLTEAQKAQNQYLLALLEAQGNYGRKQNASDSQPKPEAPPA